MAWSPTERKKRSSKCKNPKGFTMKQFCKNLKTKSEKGERKNKISSPKSKTSPKRRDFLYNKNNPKKSFDVYIDKNPSDTIPIEYKNLSDVKRTIRKLERLYKSGERPHKRIKQVAMIMMVRLNAMVGKAEEKRLARRYHSFLGERTKKKSTEERKRLT